MDSTYQDSSGVYPLDNPVPYPVMRYWQRDGPGPWEPASLDEWLPLCERAGVDYRTVGFVSVGLSSMRCEWVPGG